MMDLGQNCWYAYRSCRLWRWVKMSWIHYVLCDHHWTQCWHALRYTGYVAKIWILENPRRPPKRCWQDVRKGHLTVVRPWSWKGSDLMCVTQSYSISLSVGFLDKSPRSIGLCGSSWYPWCCGSNVWTYADAPPPPPPPPPDSLRVLYLELQLSNGT